MSRYWQLLSLALLLTACGTQTKNAADQEPDPVSAPEYSADMALYTQVSQKLVNDLARDLKTELMSALASGDAVNAINVCSKLAPELTAAHAEGGWSIRRISDRNRNPANRTDFAEAVILASFADSSTEPYTEIWTDSDSGAAYAYYQPIYTAPLCLKCHGDMQTLQPEVFGTLKKLYPLDKAVGYKVGQLRGLFVVEADWPLAREHALQLLSDSL